MKAAVTAPSAPASSRNRMARMVVAGSRRRRTRSSFQTGSGSRRLAPPGPDHRYLDQREGLQDQLPDGRRHVRPIRRRGLVLHEGPVDVAVEARAITHLEDDLRGPVAELVVQPLP